MLKITLTFLALILSSQTLIDPSAFMQKLRQEAPPDISILALDLGRTINGNTISAFGITAIPNMPAKPDTSVLKKYPSTLMTSFMHPRDDHTVELMLLSVQVLFDKFATDFHTRLMLLRGFVWVVPFINADGYEDLIRVRGLPLEERILYAKNRNVNADPDGHLNQLCGQPYQQGVNIDNNFWNEHFHEKHFCKSYYGGYDTFSEAESKALKNIFSLLKITVLIDLQAFGDFWVFPNAIERGDSHRFLPIYQDVIAKLKYGGYRVGSNDKMRHKEQIRGGGFIEWASSQGALALTYMMGQSYFLKHEEFQQVAAREMPVIQMLLKLNNPLFEKYKDSDSRVLKIISTGVLPFTLKTQIKAAKSSQSLEKTYQVKTGAILAIDTSLPYDPTEIQITLTNEDSGVSQTFQMSSLEDYTQAMAKRTAGQVVEMEAQKSNGWQQTVRFILVFIMGCAILRCCFAWWKERKRGHKKLPWKE